MPPETKNMRREVIALIDEFYNAKPEYPWERYPDYAVFRHSNHKWFAVILRVPRQKLGLESAGDVDILNVKCGPLLGGSFRSNSGIFPAYHMNKEHWISALLDGTVDVTLLHELLDISHSLTAAKLKR